MDAVIQTGCRNVALAGCTDKVIDKGQVEMGSSVATLVVANSNRKAESEQDQCHTECPAAQLT